MIINQNRRHIQNIKLENDLFQTCLSEFRAIELVPTSSFATGLFKQHQVVVDKENKFQTTIART